MRAEHKRAIEILRTYGDLKNNVDKLKKTEEFQNLTYFHTFCTAIGKLIYNRPLLNRFIINKTFYDRKYISLGFVAKKEFTDRASVEELYIRYHLTPELIVEDIETYL